MTEPLVRTPVGPLHKGQHFHYIGRITKGWLYARSASPDGRYVHAVKAKNPNGKRPLRTVLTATIDSITKDYFDDC